MALPPPNYDDALRYPVTSGSCKDVFPGERGSGRSHSDILPSYDTACSSSHRFNLTPSSSPQKTQHPPSPTQRDSPSGTTTSSQVSRTPAPAPPSHHAQSRAHDVTGPEAAHMHGVTIQVTRLEELGGGRCPSFSLGAGDTASESSQSQRTSQCSGRTSSRSVMAEANAGASSSAGASSEVHSHGMTTSHSAGASMDSYRGGTSSQQRLQDPLRPGSEDLGRRTSDTSRKSCLVPGPRAQRSCSDAGIHEESRTLAASAAATRRSSSLLPAPHHSCRCQHHHCHYHHHHHHHHQQQQQQQQQQQHRSHSCIPVHQSGSDSSVHNGHGCGRRSHSHSSISRLTVRGGGGGGGGGGGRDHSESLTHLPASSRHASSEDEEVTYVWKDNRVQVQHPPRSGPTTPDLAASGQHVQYIWRNGNVQRVVRGSNHEVLSAEVVPPREIKGINYCTVFGLMAFFVIAIVTLIFVFKVFY